MRRFAARLSIPLTSLFLGGAFASLLLMAWLPPGSPASRVAGDVFCACLAGAFLALLAGFFDPEAW